MQTLVVGVIPLGDNLMVVATRSSFTTTIKSHGIVNVLSNPAPSASLGPRAPHHVVIARIVEVVEVHVHHRDADILLPIHEFGIFLQGMTFLITEFCKGIIVVGCALLQFAILQQVDILQTVVVGNDIIGVGPLSDIQDTPVVAIDIDDGRTPRLPIDIGMFGHRTLADGITHIEIIAIVARITQHHRLIIRQSWTLVGKELILHILLAKALVAVDGHRLPRSLSRPSTCDTRLTELIQLRGLSLRIKEFQVQRSTPIFLLIFLMTIVVLENTYLTIVQVFVVNHKTDDGNTQPPIVEDIRLNAALGREPTTTKEFGTNGRRLRDGYLRCVFRAIESRLRAVSRVVNLCTRRATFWQR